SAQLAIWSPAEKLNWFWFGSVASSFISFSAVTMLNSRFAMVVYCVSPSLLPAMAVPKYRPDSAAASCRVLPAAWAEVAAMPVLIAEVSSSAAAVPSDRARRRRLRGGDVRVGVIIDPLVDVPSLVRRASKRSSSPGIRGQEVSLLVFSRTFHRARLGARRRPAGPTLGACPHPSPSTHPRAAGSSS